LDKEIRFRLIKHITFTEAELSDYSTFQSMTWKEYREDSSKRRNVERWIENLINSSVDISKIILNSEGIKPGDSYKETVKSLALVPEFNEQNILAISKWVKLRNIISHEYLDIRWSSIKNFLVDAKQLYDNFLITVRAYLEKHNTEDTEKIKNDSIS
jgi:uncharacterized protein YutE (UPF0331/DUF86 family)